MPPPHEVSFEAGLEETHRRTLELLNSRDCVVVAFNAAGKDVGRSRFISQLAEKLSPESVRVVSFENFHAIWPAKLASSDELYPGSSKIVIVFHGPLHQESRREGGYSFEWMRGHYDGILRNCSHQKGFPLPGVDIWIAFFRTDRMFSAPIKDVFGDVVIRNDKATDDNPFE